MNQLFSETKRTYKTYKNAKKVIDGLEDGNYRWIIAVNEDGRFFPVIFLNHNLCNISHFYFIDKGCCVHIF